MAIPPKKSKKKSNPFTTQKDRSVFFVERATFPLRDAPPTELEKFWARAARFEKVLTWQEAGPFNIAGRVTALAVDPRNHHRVYAGTAAGGVWLCEDTGATGEARLWKSIWPRFASQNIGALAIHPDSSEHLICITGEANLVSDSYPGSGVYKSEDSGRTWKNAFFDPNREQKPGAMTAQTGVPRRSSAIAYDPNDSSNCGFGGVTLDDRMPSGLYLYNHVHGLGPETQWGERSYNCHSLVFHKAERGMIFAALDGLGACSGIWRRDPKKGIWEQLKHGLPQGDRFGRTTLAAAPSDPDILYAVAADRRKGLLGIFRTGNCGETWHLIGKRFPGERFMSYNNTIAVHPDNPDFVIWGGIYLHRTRNRGKSWERITHGPDVHEDQHALVMPGGDLVYSGNDGGVAVSENGGNTWRKLNNGMVNTMFYAVDVAASNGKVFGGGAQDNGTLLTGISLTGIDAKEGEFERVLPGDGAWIAIDPSDEENVFGSAQNLLIYRHIKGQPWTYSPKHWKSIKPRNLAPGEGKQRAAAVLAMEPRGRKGRKAVWAGSTRLWRTLNNGASWKPVSPNFDGSVISAIEIAPANPRVIFAGTTKGGIYRSRNGGKTWSEDIAGAELPNRLITGIRTHPRDARTVVVTVASSGASGALLVANSGEEKQKPFSHVFQSGDGGHIWRDIDGGALPNVVYYALAFETRPPFRLFVAGDTGVWQSIPNGWISLGGNLPNVVVSDLKYHAKDHMLVAATYGRGIWKLPLAGVQFGL